MLQVHEIANLWPAMSPDEWAEFSADIASNGLLQPIVTWQDKIVDGKHRAIACEQSGVAPRYDALDPTWDRWRVVLHCMSLHRRRSLTADQRASVGALAVDKFAPAARERQLNANPSGGITQPLASVKAKGKNTGKAAHFAAKEADVSRSRVERVIAIRKKSPEAFEHVHAGRMPLKVAERIAKAPPEQQAAMIAQLDTGARSEDAGDSWGTPPAWIALARKVMGGIDLDPASNDEAQQTVCAKDYYTAKQDGLSHNWDGRVWLNPPYSQPLVTRFAEKLIAEIDSGRVTQACVLVNNATDTKFAQLLLSRCSAALFPEGRISFVLPGGGELAGTRQGQMLLYFGLQTKRFVSAAKSFGWIGVAP